MTMLQGFYATLILAWLLSPPFLVLLAARIWRRGRPAENWKTRAYIAIGSAAIANWILFVVLFIKALTSEGAVFQTSPFTHGLLLLSCFAVVGSLVVSRWGWSLLLANLVLTTLWVAIAYAPSHWLKDWNYGSVKIDGRPTPASVYIGNPTNSEAEAIVLVHVPAAGDYFLSFAEEKVRITTVHEYLRLPGGVWCFTSLRDMAFIDPLPSQQINEFRIASPKGGVVSVQF